MPPDATSPAGDTSSRDGSQGSARSSPALRAVSGARRPSASCARERASPRSTSTPALPDETLALVGRRRAKRARSSERSRRRSSEFGGLDVVVAERRDAARRRGRPRRPARRAASGGAHSTSTSPVCFSPPSTACVRCSRPAAARSCCTGSPAGRLRDRPGPRRVFGEQGGRARARSRARRRLRARRHSRQRRPPRADRDADEPLVARRRGTRGPRHCARCRSAGSASAEEVAAVIAFLASDEASYVTGAVWSRRRRADRRLTRAAAADVAVTRRPTADPQQHDRRAARSSGRNRDGGCDSLAALPADTERLPARGGGYGRDAAGRRSPPGVGSGRARVPARARAANPSLEQAELAATLDSLGAARGVELAIDRARVRLDRVEREVERGADLAQ